MPLSLLPKAPVFAAADAEEGEELEQGAEGEGEEGWAEGDGGRVDCLFQLEQARPLWLPLYVVPKEPECRISAKTNTIEVIFEIS